MRGFTTEEFIKRAKDKHGEFFDYSETVYVNRRTKVYIVCPVHGGFWQYPEIHMKSDYGCPICGHEGGGVVRRYNFESFVLKANAVHGSRYSYEKVDYVNSVTKVEIICKKHGSYMQTPVAHISGQGCPLCGLETISKKKRFTTSEIIEKFKEVHGDKYDYSQVEYKGLKEKVKIKCHEHGFFLQTPADHIYSKAGCPICASIINGKQQRQTKDEFVDKANKVHRFKYDYSLVPEDSLSNEKVPIICPEHGLFMQIKNNHLKGAGCPHCPKSCISLGEKRVSEILDALGVEYIPQYKIKNESVSCKNKNLFVDFYLPNYNLFVEYNGSQHYEADFYFGGEERLKRQQERDTALRKYCNEHDISLIEIPYWDYDNIETIVMDKLK